MQIKQVESKKVLEIFNNKSAIFVDVREPHEWEAGVIPNALKISLGSIGNNLAKFDKNQNYMLVCRSGRRSDVACEILYKAGITNVSNYSDGMLGWYENDYPLGK
jgi:rhodanese-related sulfurtransferase